MWKSNRFFALQLSPIFSHYNVEFTLLNVLSEHFLTVKQLRMLQTALQEPTLMTSCSRHNAAHHLGPAECSLCVRSSERARPP